MFDKSPISMQLFGYLSDNYSPAIANIGIIKACSIASARIHSLMLPRLNVLNVAPSRQFKTQITRVAMSLFPKDYIYYPGSDFTIFELSKQYKKKQLNHRCVCINDMTLLMSSKSKRTKDRLICGMAEIMADGHYSYGERLQSEQIVANISCIANMTPESYWRYEQFLSESTWSERVLTLFHNVPMEDMVAFQDKRQSLPKLDIKIRVGMDTSVSWTMEDQKRINRIAQDYMILSMHTFSSFAEALRALCISHAAINARDYVCEDDFDLVNAIRKNVAYNENNNSRILSLYVKGHSQKEICEILGKNPMKYKAYVSRILMRARSRGIISPEKEKEISEIV